MITEDTYVPDIQVLWHGSVNTVKISALMELQRGAEASAFMYVSIYVYGRMRAHTRTHIM